MAEMISIRLGSRQFSNIEGTDDFQSGRYPGLDVGRCTMAREVAERLMSLSKDLAEIWSACTDSEGRRDAASMGALSRQIRRSLAR